MGNIKFKFTVKLVPGMRITTFRINATRLNSTQFSVFQSPSNPNEYEGELEAICIESTVEVSVYGVGTPFLEGTFNVSKNGDNLFLEDQKLSIKGGGRFRFYKPEVKLP